MAFVRISHRLIILGQLLFLSCCTSLPQVTEQEFNATSSNSNLDRRVTVVAPSPVRLSSASIEAVVTFLAQYFEYMPLLDESLISPDRNYYGCLDSDEAGVILNYEVKSSFKDFYPLFREKFSTANWNYQETEIIKDDLNHRMMFLKASTIRHDSTVIDIQGIILESLPNPDRLSIWVTFSHISNSINYQNFENNPSNASPDWILSNPKGALLKLCSDGYWSVLNP